MILHLNLKAKWFDMIASGEKTEEYREIKPYWFERLAFQHERVFKYCTGYDYKQGLFLQEGIQFCCTKNNYFGFKPFEFIEFKNGYHKNARTMMFEFKGITCGPAKPELSDNWQGNVFIIKLGKILSK